MNQNKPEFQNVLIPDLKSNKAYKYDTKENEFKHTFRDELINDLIENRLNDISDFYKDFYNKQ